MELFCSPEFASHVEELARRNRVPGLSIAVVQNDRVESTGFGMASIEDDKACTADMLFDIASSSKSLTAASIALLVDDNENYPEIQYDSVMSELLHDDFVMAEDEYTKGITIDDILGHRTGMPG
jgi:CubicO group peptidase (beta-lactamase class C family)